MKSQEAIACILTVSLFAHCGQNAPFQLPDDYSPGPSGPEYDSLVGMQSEGGSLDTPIGGILGTICGEPVYYNGEDTTNCLGKSCSDPSSNGAFGLLRQCTEFAARFACNVSLGCTKKDGRYGNAKDWFSGEFSFTSNILKLIPAERRFRSGETKTVPQPGDIITFSIPADTGHVAIVEQVDITKNTIYTYDQNTRHAFRIPRNISIDAIGIVTVKNAIGWMRPSVEVPLCLRGDLPTSFDYAPFSGFSASPPTNWAVITDFNNDSKLDVIVAGAANISALSGNGDGTLNLHKDYQLNATKASHIIAVDVDLNGKVDVVTANEPDGTISVIIGNGDGSFLLPKTYPVGQYPMFITSGDLNRDGKPDLLVVNAGSSSRNFSVLINKGDGTFFAAQNTPAGQAPRSIFVGDVNADNKLDAIVTNTYDANIGVFFGNGDGSFQLQKTYSTSLNPQHSILADVNSDGKLDIIVTNLNMKTIGILLGNGDGTFKSQYEFPSPAQYISAVDINLDKKIDIAYTNINTGTAGVYIGNGDGTFMPNKEFSIGLNPIGIAVGDLNGDRIPDILAASWAQDRVNILLSRLK